METSANNDGLFVLAFYIGLPLVLLAVQWLIGGAIERRHLKMAACTVSGTAYVRA